MPDRYILHFFLVQVLSFDIIVIRIYDKFPIMTIVNWEQLNYNVSVEQQALGLGIRSVSNHTHVCSRWGWMVGTWDMC